MNQLPRQVLMFLIMLWIPILAQRPANDSIREARTNTLRLLKMTEELHLNEAQTAGLFPLYREHRDQLKKFHHQRRKIIEDMEKVARANTFRHEDKERLLTQFDQLNDEIMDENKLFRDKIAKLLDERQFIQFLVFEEKFLERVRDMLNEIHPCQPSQHRPPDFPQ